MQMLTRGGLEVGMDRLNSSTKDEVSTIESFSVTARSVAFDSPQSG
jgi:hypothetical protein